MYNKLNLQQLLSKDTFKIHEEREEGIHWFQSHLKFFELRGEKRDENKSAAVLSTKSNVFHYKL